jgi:hypothetical protein
VRWEIGGGDEGEIPQVSSLLAFLRIIRFPIHFRPAPEDADQGLLEGLPRAKLYYRLAGIAYHNRSVTMPERCQIGIISGAAAPAFTSMRRKAGPIPAETVSFKVNVDTVTWLHLL